MDTRISPVHVRDAEFEACADGSLLVRNPEPLGSYPRRMTEWLERWAARTPDRPFLAARSGKGWRKVSYAEALAAVRAIGQGLLDRGLSAERPVLILSGNSIEHALLSLACLHVGVPFVPISTAYSLVSSDFGRLRGIVELVRPGLIFADDGDRYAAALRACTPEYAEITVVHGDPCRPTVPFDALLAGTATAAVSAAAEAVHADTVAKLLFTSGSTGVPKAVISTQRTLCSITEMLLTCYPARAEGPPVLVDWLPWSHVFGSTCFGTALFSGGTLHRRRQAIAGSGSRTVAICGRLRRRSIRTCRKVMRNWCRWLRRDRALRKAFFSRVRILQFGGASLARHIFDAFDELALDTVGERIQWMPVFASTEGGVITACRDAPTSLARAVSACRCRASR